MSEWRDIETAPADTPILIYDPLNVTQRVNVAQFKWCEDWLPREWLPTIHTSLDPLIDGTKRQITTTSHIAEFRRYRLWDVEHGFRSDRIRHWQPVPKPPTT